MKKYKTYNLPGSEQRTREVKTFNLKVIWDDEDGSLIRCEIPKEVMKWDWIEAADFFTHLQGWAHTQVEAIYYQLDKKTKTPFSDAVASKKIDTLYELKVNKAGYGQEGQP